MLTTAFLLRILHSSVTYVTLTIRTYM